MTMIHDSPVYFGDDALLRIKELFRNDYSDSKKIVLVDSNTGKFCLPYFLEKIKLDFSFELIEVPAGEEYKNIESCIAIWAKLGEAGIDKNSLLINLGGGMICDLGGFVAATFLRGFRSINVPTSLLGMTDASYGGKTGINFQGVKNRVGVFANPESVFIFPELLKTLPEREFKSGLAEVFKHALIADEKMWQEMTSMRLNAETITPLIRRSVEIKKYFVDQDFRDNGIRHALNFGHTIAHALEAHSLKVNKNPILHGEAVAAGIIAESYLSHLNAGLQRDVLDEIISVIQKKFDYLQFELDYPSLMEFMLADKKNLKESVNFTMISWPGKVCINMHATNAQIKEALGFTFECFMKAAR